MKEECLRTWTPECYHDMPTGRVALFAYESEPCYQLTPSDCVGNRRFRHGCFAHHAHVQEVKITSHHFYSHAQVFV